MQISANKNQVFTGSNALNDFLNPEKHALLPLVELPPKLNPFSKDGVKIYAKMLNLLPLGNVKAISAYRMFTEAQSQSGLSGKKKIIEYSSGNTIFSAAAIARQFGINKIKTLISHEAFWSRIQMLRFLGIEVEIHKEPTHPEPNDPRSGIQKVLALGKRKDTFCLKQYENQANPHAHERLTGPQIWKQMEGKITHFCAGIGTAGTVVGTSKFLKSKKSTITTIGVARKVDSPVPGVRSKPRLALLHFPWQKWINELEEVGMKESYTASMKLCREGLLVGPSSGFAYAGLMHYLKRLKKGGRLDDIRDAQGEIHAVFICCDGPFQYLDEYFDYVDASMFPSVHNEHLMLNQRHKDDHRHEK